MACKILIGTVYTFSTLRTKYHLSLVTSGCQKHGINFGYTAKSFVCSTAHPQLSYVELNIFL